MNEMAVNEKISAILKTLCKYNYGGPRSLKIFVTNKRWDQRTRLPLW